jgi:uncharacterized protein
MSKLSISTVCFVVAANLVLVNHPAISAMPTGEYLLAQSSTQKNKVIEDEIFADIGLNRVDRLQQFLNGGGSANRYFHAAVNSGTIDCVKLMLSRGANVNLAGDEGVTPLMTAVRVTYRGGVEMTELLIKKRANVNARAGKGSTALMYASSSVAAHYEDDYVRVVRLLIKHGAKVNVKNQMGATPLSIAKGGNWKKIVTALKKAGAKA